MFLSLFILSVGTLVAWILTKKIVGEQAGLQFAGVGALVVSAIFVGQLSIYSRAKTTLYFQLVFLGTFGFTMGWLMLCLFMPVFWLDTIGIYTKIAAGVIFLLVSASNIALAFRELDKKWEAIGQPLFEKMHNPSINTIDWEKIATSMQITGRIYLPGVPKILSNVISVAIGVFMLAGLSLRNSYPVFSVFAWGIPSAILATFFMQMSGYQFAQAGKVAILEGKLKRTFRATE